MSKLAQYEIPAGLKEAQQRLGRMAEFAFRASADS